MDVYKIKALCENLIEADSEEDVIDLLKAAGFWDDPAVWRHYGDNENNYSSIGNQQSRPDAALVEKIVNSVDARLMIECLIRGINPEGPDAPQSIREAVAWFFEEHPDSATAGLVSEWSNEKRRDTARQITVAATGKKPPNNPCITIADCGEGQTPSDMPDTLLSLNKKIKLRIPFVQGKFNMGGTGVLQFCGRNNLQLILSRRNTEITKNTARDKTDFDWGFTVVRRENPGGGVRSSVYKYLAPIDSSARPGYGTILNFPAETMKIFPSGNDAYAVDSEWGTLIKLYEYNIPYRSNILMQDGLLSRIDLLLPSCALPIRFHECRDYSGHEGSFETTVLGLNVRLGDASRDVKRQTIEESFPISCPFTVEDEEMTATIYAFRKNKGKAYRKNEGVIFSVNGQTHGHFTTDFFGRKKSGCSYLRDSLMVVVDCSELSGRAREDLFMNSRDRLRDGPLRRAIEKEIESLLRESKLLKQLREKRQREQRDSLIEESKPLEDALKKILGKSPTLSKLFLKGVRLSAPFKTTAVDSVEEKYEGKKYPTYFKFKGMDYGITLRRNCHKNVRARITFETDVVNDYFAREIDKGTFSLKSITDGEERKRKSDSIRLENGIATFNLTLPENVEVGDKLLFSAEVNDRTLIEPFTNSFEIIVLKETEKRPSDPGKRRKPGGKKKGKDRETAMMFAPPNPTKVYENPKEGQVGWDTMEPPFDQHTALVIRHSISDENGEDEQEIYDFWINVDNLYLKTEQKDSKRDPKILEACFLYGMILVGISLIHDDLERGKSSDANLGTGDSDNSEKGLEDRVAEFTRAIAPILLPMIENLGSFEEDFDSVDNMAGEAA